MAHVNSLLTIALLYHLAKKVICVLMDNALLIKLIAKQGQLVLQIILFNALICNVLIQ